MTLMNLVMSTYSDEPCRICRKLITFDETQNIVFTGYTDIDGKVSRASHTACWQDLSDEARQRIKDDADLARRRP